MSKSLQIVAFNLPYPADYGGVIDVFHKIRWLHKQGVKIYLHAFVYGREDLGPLKEYCEKIFLYPRKTGLLSQLSFLPYIVNSRKTPELEKNITEISAPVLFEGLHTCYFLYSRHLTKLKKIYRESNIEHSYYYHLYKEERSPFKKFYYLLEALRLKVFEKNISNADLILAVNKEDKEYFSANYPRVKSVFLPSFHGNDTLEIKQGRGDYFLYHGNLSVLENHTAAGFLIEKVFNDLQIPLIIAGKQPTSTLKALISNAGGQTRLVENPDNELMESLIKNAHAHVLPTFQPTGLKLKLLNALFRGRFCLVNPEMLSGNGLENACIISNSPEQWKQNILQIWNMEFSYNELEQRRNHLLPYMNEENIKKLMELI